MQISRNMSHEIKLGIVGAFKPFEKYLSIGSFPGVGVKIKNI